LQQYLSELKSAPDIINCHNRNTS